MSKQKRKIKEAILDAINNRVLMTFEDTNQSNFLYKGFIEALTMWKPEKRIDAQESILYHPDKNTFLVHNVNESIHAVDITDEIINKLLTLKICLQVNTISYKKLKPIYNAYIKGIFEEFLFDKERYEQNQKLNEKIGQNILNKNILPKIQNQLFNTIEKGDYTPTNRILFDLLVPGTTQWYVDSDEQIVVSSWGESDCKVKLLTLLTENNRHLKTLLLFITDSIPEGYSYLIGIGKADFKLTPVIYESFAKDNMRISIHEGYLFATHPKTNDNKDLFRSLSIKSLTSQKSLTNK
jgi:hypothetical protein